MDRNGQKEALIEEGATAVMDGAFARCNEVIKAVIPESVSVIGTAAFNGCDALENVVIPESVTVIRGKAFYGCGALRDVTIPEHVATIGAYAFSDCSNLKSVEMKNKMPPTIGEAVFDVNVAGFKIRVPEESAENYKMAWKEYEAYIVTE